MTVPGDERKIWKIKYNILHPASWDESHALRMQRKEGLFMMVTMKKRFTAAVAGITLLFTAWGGAVWAAQSDATLGFDGLETNLELTKENIAATIKEGSNYSQVDGGNIVSENKAQVTDGTFGKTTGDKSVHFYRSADSTAADPGNGMKLGLAGEMNTGEYTEVEVYMAWAKDCNATKGVIGYYRGYSYTGESETGNDGITSSYLFGVNKDGLLYVMGENTGIYLPAEKWYKFNLVMKAGTGSYTTTSNGNGTDSYGNYPVKDSSNTNRYWFYLDNIPVKEDAALNAKGLEDRNGWKKRYKDFTGLSYIFPGMRTSDRSQSSGVWMDDISVSQGITELPQYTKSRIAVSENADANSVARLYDGAVTGLTQFVDERVDLGELNVDGKAFGETGSKLSAEEKAYALTNAGGEKLYAMAINTTIPEKVYNMTSDKPNVSFSNSAGSASTPTGSIAGSADGNAYIKVAADTAKAWASQEDSTVTLYPGHSGLNAPKTVELSVLMQDTREFKVTMKSAANKWYTPIAMAADGTVTIDRYTSKRVVPGTWTRIAVTLYPAAGKAEVFVNGERAAVTGCDTTFHSVAYLRLLGMFADDGNGKNADGYFAYDDIHMYYGSKPAASTDPKLTLTANAATVGDGVIFVPKTALDQSSFYADLNATGGDLSDAYIYRDATFAEKIGERDSITEGNILVVPRTLDQDAAAYSYYYLSLSGAAPLDIVGLSKPLTVGKNENVTATIHCYQPVPDCSALILAKYRGEELTGILKREISAIAIAGHSGNYAYPYQMATEPFDMTLEEGETVKAFVFNSMGKLVPLLSEARTLYGK